MAIIRIEYPTLFSINREVKAILASPLMATQGEQTQCAKAGDHGHWCDAELEAAPDTRDSSVLGMLRLSNIPRSPNVHRDVHGLGKSCPRAKGALVSDCMNSCRSHIH